MLKLVVFDCDGTLYNSVGGIEQGLSETFAYHGFASVTVSSVGRLLAYPMPHVIAHLLDLPQGHPDIAPIVDTYHHIMDCKQTGDLYPDVIPMLETLHHRGYLMAMVTGMGGRGVNALFATFAIGQYFDKVKHADNGARKPNPQSLFDCVNQLGIASMRDVVMVGDTVTDMHYARNAGCASIGTTWGVPCKQKNTEYAKTLVNQGGATVVAHSVSELLPLIEQCIGSPE